MDIHDKLYIHRVPKATNSCQQLSQILTDFQNFFTDRLSSKFLVKQLLIIRAYLKYVAALHWGILISEN